MTGVWHGDHEAKGESKECKKVSGKDALEAVCEEDNRPSLYEALRAAGAAHSRVQPRCRPGASEPYSQL